MFVLKFRLKLKMQLITERKSSWFCQIWLSNLLGGDAFEDKKYVNPQTSNALALANIKLNTTKNTHSMQNRM